MSTNRIITIALAISITFVQEQLLLFIPNVQFTILLIILFTRYFTFRESTIYIMVYVLLDNMYMGSLNLLYTPPMFVGWMLIPVAQKLFLHKMKTEFSLALFAFVFGFVYSWIFIPVRMLEMGISQFWPYFLLDIPFEVILASTGFLTVIFLFKPLNNVLSQLITENGYNQNPKKYY